MCKQIRRPIAPLKAGKFFNLTIIPIAGDGFTITLAGNAPVIVENAGMPPWAAQYLRVKSELIQLESEIQNRFFRTFNSKSEPFLGREIKLRQKLFYRESMMWLIH